MKPMNNGKHWKSSIKYCEGNNKRKFYDNEKPKEGFHCIFLTVKLKDSVFKMIKNYYP